MSKAMEVYAEKRNKKNSEVTEVRVQKAKGGFIVTVGDRFAMERDGKPSVYKDLAGVARCLEEKFK